MKILLILNLLLVLGCHAMPEPKLNKFHLDLFDDCFCDIEYDQHCFKECEDRD